MWITNTITARMLICLAGFSIPLQGLPVASCACCPQDLQSKGSDCCSTLDPTDQVLSVQAATNVVRVPVSSIAMTDVLFEKSKKHAMQLKRQKNRVVFQAKCPTILRVNVGQSVIAVKEKNLQHPLHPLRWRAILLRN